MVSLFVAVTDWDWFDYLRSQPELTEVNFWQPGGNRRFSALKPGELFLFKLHSPRNFIAGGGVFTYANILPASLAWEAFGAGNGANSIEEMRRRIVRYRRQNLDPHADYQIGCIILEDTFFFDEPSWIPIPASWSRTIVQGKRYLTQEDDGLRLWNEIQARLQDVGLPRHAEVRGLYEEQARFGSPTLITPRLGQGAFRIVVTDAYERRCAVTKERTLPALDAAHIRPYSLGGAHDVRNGILLRRDIHPLFDLGYVTVTRDYRFEVSRRIREDFENGSNYYAMHGRNISVPESDGLKPDPQILEWHNTAKYLG